MASPKALLASARERRPALDHLIRAYTRYQADAGDRQAAAVTFFAFLSFFPLLALAASILTYAIGDDAVATVVEQVNSYAPGLADQLGLETILTNNRAAGAAGLIGLAGLLYSGLGWVDALREAVRAIWHHNVKAGNIIVKKLTDVLVLAGLGLTIVLSVGVSAATGAFTDVALEAGGLGTGLVATSLVKIVGVLLGLVTSTALFLFLLWRLPKVQSPFRRVLKGALLAAALFEVLKRIGALYIERTTENPIYGAFAVIVGLLVWINIVSRVFLLCAAWTVTAPYDSDVPPSGTANPELAREAGIPTEFADTDPDAAPALQQDGAPSPLAAAVQGATPSQDEPEGRESTPQPGRGRDQRALVGASASRGGPVPARSVDPRQAAKVQRAGSFTAGALGMVVTAVVLHIGRTMLDVLRR